jgi:cytochrome c6
MLPDRTRHFAIRASTILIGLVACLTLGRVSIVGANPGPDGAASSATYRTKCAICHGPDGAGSEVGKSMKVPDLRAPVVQKLPDADLAQVISSGKGGMPAFKNSLREDQIHALVVYVRSLHQKK